MANMYRSVLSGGGQAPTGDAVAADVLTGKTFSNANATGISGTMPNNGAVSGTATPSQPYTIPAGYHNGSGVVTASVADALLPNNGDYIVGNDNQLTTGQYSGTAIGPSTATTLRGFGIINVKNYNSATTTGSWVLYAWGIKNGVITSIPAPSEGLTVDISNYDYFVWMTEARQFTFA